MMVKTLANDEATFYSSVGCSSIDNPAAHFTYLHAKTKLNEKRFLKYAPGVLRLLNLRTFVAVYYSYLFRGILREISEEL